MEHNKNQQVPPWDLPFQDVEELRVLAWQILVLALPPNCLCDLGNVPSILLSPSFITHKMEVSNKRSSAHVKDCFRDQMRKGVQMGFVIFNARLLLPQYQQSCVKSICLWLVGGCVCILVPPEPSWSLSFPLSTHCSCPAMGTFGDRVEAEDKPGNLGWGEVLEGGNERRQSETLRHRLESSPLPWHPGTKYRWFLHHDASLSSTRCFHFHRRITRWHSYHGIVAWSLPLLPAVFPLVPSAHGYQVCPS